MPTVKVRDIHLHYDLYGAGEPLLLIQGLGLDAGAWINQVLALSPHYRVLSFDNRGVGRSAAPATPYSTAIMAADTIALLDALGIDRPHVVGFSMGGLIAQMLALHYPERVRSLTLASTAAQLPAVAKLVIQGWSQLLREKIRPEARIRLQLPWLFSEQFLQNADQVDALVQASLHYPYQPTIQGFAGQVSACLEHSTLARLSEIAAPTLVLAAEADRLIPLPLCQQLAASLPKAEIQVIAGGGHNCFWDMADRFNQAVLQFVRRF